MLDSSLVLDQSTYMAKFSLKFRLTRNFSL